jgi:tetratricopeptide (TPR) repeat protein
MTRFLLVAFLLVAAAWPKSDLPQELDDHLLEGVRLLHCDRYDDAFSNFISVQRAASNHPAGYFFHGAALEWMAWDYRNLDQGPAFFVLMNKTIALAKAMVAKNPKNPWALFYLGGGYGFLGLADIKYGNWLKAFFDGQTGYKHMLAALKLKPDLWDVYYGLGQFHYWRSKKASIIRVFTTQDEMKLGIEELLTATEKGYFTRWEARNALVDIYNSEKQPERSEALLKASLAEFPENLYSWWSVAKLYMNQGKYGEALAALDFLESRFQKSKWTGDLAWVECWVWKADCWGHLRDKAKTREYLEKARRHNNARIKSLPRYLELMRDIKNISQWAGVELSGMN